MTFPKANLKRSSEDFRRDLEKYADLQWSFKTPYQAGHTLNPLASPNWEELYFEDEEKATIKRHMIDRITNAKDRNQANNRHDVTKVSPNFHTYYNSVNILTGSQGAGKTFTALMEALGVVNNTENTTDLIFIKKKNYDPTFENVRDMFSEYGCRVTEVEYKDAENTVEILFQAKRIYNAVKRYQYFKHSGEPVDPAEFEELTDEIVDEAAETLAVDDFRLPWLNTIIIFDDVGNSGLFKNPDSYFNNRLKLCRDDNAIYFLTIHGITQLSPSIKENTLIVYAFKGLSPNRLDVIFRQMNILMDLGEFRGIYNNMMKMGQRYFCCDNNTGNWETE
jgi:hypothetical protein